MSHPLALPKNFSPDALDTSTELATILARLRLPTADGSATTPAAGGPSGGGPSGRGGGPVSGSGAAISGGPSGPGGAAAAAASTPAGDLHLRDLPTATDSLKHKLHHARTQVKLLPDVGRTVAEQAAEIERLEERVRQQREVLARLRAAGVQFATDQQQREKMQA